MKINKIIHNKMMSIKMPRKLARGLRYMGNRKKMAKAVRARDGGKGQSDGEGGE